MNKIHHKALMKYFSPIIIENIKELDNINIHKYLEWANLIFRKVICQ